jgi:lysine-specific demethylase 8
MYNTSSMSDYVGPSFQLVDQIDASPDASSLSKAFAGSLRTSTPLLVKGALRSWPAWSFEYLASLRRPNGEEVVTEFQDGLIEQGETKERQLRPVAPYLMELAEAAHQRRIDDQGWLTTEQYNQLKPGESFHLNWSYMQTFQANKLYLGLWHILAEFPQLRKDLCIRSIIPGWRWTMDQEYVFLGPSHTVTGLHYDDTNNWFCQIRGTKEVILFAPNQDVHLCKNNKYEQGTKFSDIDITNLPLQPHERAEFAKAHGYYALVETGDVLYLPAHYCHAVLALEPSISLAVFALTLYEIVTIGILNIVLEVLHRLGLYGNGNCTCHKPAARNQQKPL